PHRCSSRDDPEIRDAAPSTRGEPPGRMPATSPPALAAPEAGTPGDFENAAMRPDKYKRRQQAPRADDRLRLQIAQEAARRLYPRLAPEAGAGPLGEASEAEFYAAKRRAAAVLGRRV